MEGDVALKRAITLGSFDPLHAGHLGLFAQCRRLADELVVGVNSDTFYTKYRGVAPLMPQYHRMAVIGALKGVNEVVLNDGGMWQSSIIEQSGADLIVVGDDWAGRDYYAQLGVTQRWLDNNRIQLVYVPRTGGFSSTTLKARA